MHNCIGHFRWMIGSQCFPTRPVRLPTRWQSVKVDEAWEPTLFSSQRKDLQNPLQFLFILVAYLKFAFPVGSFKFDLSLQFI